jgi:predicted short-subunit dehydrogenase-like oxidoreductase (DUF2520 family)
MPSGKIDRLSIQLIGPGRLGSALARNLKRAGWSVETIIVRKKTRMPLRVLKLAKEVGARAAKLGSEPIPAGLVLITVPDGSIARVAADIAGRQPWRGRIVFHCSGALTSDALEPLRARGAKVASVHPLMTFAANTTPDLKGVSFGVEGDAVAVRLAKRIVRDLGGVPVDVRKENKVLYHAFGAFASPMVIALMAAMEEVGDAAGLSRKNLSALAGPLLRQTLENYLERGAAAAFTGPLVRGDADVIDRHLKALKKTRLAREVYLALAKVAIKKLPVKRHGAVRKTIGRHS